MIKEKAIRRIVVSVLLTGLLIAGVTSGSLFAGTLNLEYSTYLGGSSEDKGYGISLGTDGTIYVTGSTVSVDFPTASPYQAGYGGGSYDAFVTALSSTGSVLSYSTYLGGSDADRGWSISVGTNATAYVTGETASSDFPTVNPYQTTYGGGSNDVFVSALSSSGSVLSFSTYLGGNNRDFATYGMGISVGTDGQSYIIGYTQSSNFPTVNPYQASLPGSASTFVSALSSTGSGLSYSTYLGGSGPDFGIGISLRTDGAVSVVGYTLSSDFPLVNPYQAYTGSMDAFVSTLSSSGSALSFSTCLGGNDQEYGFGISVGSDGQSYVTGWTKSADFPTVNPYQSSFAGGTWDVFVSALSSAGSNLSYSTYLGGSGNDQVFAIGMGTAGAAYLTGRTSSTDFPTTNPYQAGSGGGAWDTFVSIISPTGSNLSASTYLGGSSLNEGRGISVGAAGEAYVTGFTNSSDFPMENPYQATHAGGTSDAFVSRLALVASPTLTPSVTPTPSVMPTPTSSVPPTPTPSVTSTPSVTPTPSVPPTPEPTETPTPVSTATPSPTPTCGPTIDPQSAVIASGDYDGDGTDNIAIFRAGSGLWAIRGISRAYFGTSADLPVPGDYSGDDTAEIAIYRGSSGLWAIKGLTRFYLGSGSIPVPGDYDGDGSCDAGVFTASSGRWQIRDITSVFYGRSLDWPIPGDFDGNGTAEIGIFRPAYGLWAIRGYTRAYYGRQDDWPVPGDYDGDGMEEIAIWRPCSGLWARRGITRIYYGTCIDWPRPADYDGNGAADLGIFREATSLWAVRGITRAYYGGVGDIPATR